MKKFFGFLIKLALLGVIVAAMWFTNPEEARHRDALFRKMNAQTEEDLLEQATAVAYEATENMAHALGMSSYAYHDYHLLSMVRENGSPVTLGIFHRVFVFKTDFSPE